MSWTCPGQACPPPRCSRAACRRTSRARGSPPAHASSREERLLAPSREPRLVQALAESRLRLACISAASRLHLHLGCISPARRTRSARARRAACRSAARSGPARARTPPPRRLLRRARRPVGRAPLSCRRPRRPRRPRRHSPGQGSRSGRPEHGGRRARLTAQSGRGTGGRRRERWTGQTRAERHRDLVPRVHALVRAATAGDVDAAAEQRREARLEDVLDAAAARLCLPPDILCAVVLNAADEACGLPRLPLLRLTVVRPASRAKRGRSGHAPAPNTDGRKNTLST